MSDMLSELPTTTPDDGAGARIRERCHARLRAANSGPESRLDRWLFAAAAVYFVMALQQAIAFLL